MNAIGGYQLLGRISTDPPIFVWKGREQAGDREVVLKQIELTIGEPMARVRAQARLLAEISHPSITEVLDLVEDETHAWLVEAWFEGAELSTLLAEGGPISSAESMALIDAALSGLVHAHERAIVHGNITPKNLLVSGSGVVKLTNFGMSANQLANGCRSPEVIAGEPITPGADVYSIAAVLGDLLAAAEGEAEWKRLRHLNVVIDKALAPHPADRYRNAGEFHRALVAAADVEFGPSWRDEVPRAVAVVVSLGPATTSPVDESADYIRPGGSSSMAAIGSGSSVAVRSSEKSGRPAADEPPGMRELLETRSLTGGALDSKSGRLIPILAGVVVLAAIIILVLTHRNMNGSSARPGLNFRGNYDVNATLMSAGVGADAGKPAGSIVAEKWRVTPTCTSTTSCTAAVVPGHGSPFTLTLRNDAWTGQRPMTADPQCADSSPKAGLYSVALNEPASSSGQNYAGAMLGVFGGCGQVAFENATLQVSRAGG